MPGPRDKLSLARAHSTQAPGAAAGPARAPGAAPAEEDVALARHALPRRVQPEAAAARRAQRPRAARLAAAPGQRALLGHLRHAVSAALSHAQVLCRLSCFTCGPVPEHHAASAAAPHAH